MLDFLIAPAIIILNIHLCFIDTYQKAAGDWKTWADQNHHCDKTFINVEIHKILHPNYNWYEPVLKNWINLTIVKLRNLVWLSTFLVKLPVRNHWHLFRWSRFTDYWYYDNERKRITGLVVIRVVSTFVIRCMRKFFWLFSGWMKSKFVFFQLKLLKMFMVVDNIWKELALAVWCPLQ